MKISEKQFDYVYNEYAKELYKIAYGYTHNREDSIDIMQNAYVALLESKKEFESYEHIKYFLIRVAINESLDLLKSANKKVIRNNDYVNNIPTTNKEELPYDLSLIINTLPEKHKKIIILHYYDDMKIKEISNVLKISEYAVKKRLERARNLIKEIIERKKMIDKELLELKNNIPDIDIKCFKKGVYKKYESRNKNNVVLRYKSVFIYGIIIFFALLTIILIPKNMPDESKHENPLKEINPIYNDFIKDSFENNIGNTPTFNISGPQPASPIIDGYFNVSQTNTITPNPSIGPSYVEYPTISGLETFEYIYEVEYSTTGIKHEFVTVYVERNLVNKIYAECKNVDDAPIADSVEIVNGSIVDWFYSKAYYDENKVFWCGYENSDEIYSEIEGYVCVGVFYPQKREVIREIFSNEFISIIDDIYTKLYFKNEGNEFLIPIIDEVENKVKWYASNEKINEMNKYLLFDDCYSSQMNCYINRELDTIKLETFAVQGDELEKNNYVSTLKQFHILSNQIIMENDQINKKFGDISFITYSYQKFVELLQDLNKHIE